MYSRDASVLIVDDDPDTLTFLETCLRDRYNCATASSAEEASKILATCPFDVVLADVMLPGDSGFDLCRKVRGRYPDTAVIIMSAGPEIEFEIEATRNRALGYLKKPFSIHRLYSSLEHALRHRQLLKELRSAQKSA